MVNGLASISAKAVDCQFSAKQFKGLLQMYQHVQVRRNNPAEARIAVRTPDPLPSGGVRFAIESFSITSNNVTYAMMGEDFGYWNFFPAEDEWGIVPMWGHARVAESRHPDFAEGERVYGYLPMAGYLDVMPGRVSASGFTDITPHRQPMSAVYNQYSRLAADPEHDPAHEGERMIFGPLFKTGFLIESFMRREDWFGADALVVTSASSKTAMGLASVARHRSPQVKRIGLTSGSNVAFVEQTGFYDQVIAYENLESLSTSAAVVVDFAGNPDLVGRLHRHLSDALKYSCMVGATHVNARGDGAGGDMPGPAPVLFFAPDHAVAAVKDLGPEQFGRDIAASWHAFLNDLGSSVQIERSKGLNAALDLFTGMVKGAVNPAQGIVIEP